jgi:DNA-3-methyladenine glycosylase
VNPVGRAISDGALRARFARPLAGAWYDRPTLDVAEDLLGKWIVRREGGRFRAGRIVETEGYLASDPASHAYHGETPRNRAMYGSPGTLYVFRIHQVDCANAVTRRGEAVLVRAAEPVAHLEGSATGPGRLARAFGLTVADSGASLITSEFRIVAAARPREPIVRTPRVGLSRARESLYRFLLSGNRWVSPPRPAVRTTGGRTAKS